MFRREQLLVSQLGLNNREEATNRDSGRFTESDKPVPMRLTRPTNYLTMLINYIGVNFLIFN